MNKNELEKESRILEARNRDLRNKNSDLQSENNRLFNDKISIERNTKDALRRSSEALEEKRLFEISLTEVKKKIKVELLEIAKQKATLDQEDKKLKDLNQALSNEQEAIQKERLELVKIEDKLKQKSLDLQKGISDLNEDRKRLVDEGLKIKEAWKNIENSQRKLKEQTLVTADNFIRSEVNIAKSKELLEQVNKKGEQIDKTLMGLKVREDNLINAEKLCEVHRKENELWAKKNQDETDHLKDKEKSLDKAFANISLKEKEIEVRRLRMEKIIKEKGITEELRQLEEDLKK